MAWVFGAGLGFLLGGPLGAIVGGSLQHFLSKDAQRNFEQGRPENDLAFFVTYLTTIMTKISMADGRVSKSEIEMIRSFFINGLGFSGMEIRYVEGLIAETQRLNPDIGVVARDFKKNAGHEDVLRLLDICYQVAAADGTISLQEQHELGFLAESLGISREEHERIKYKYSGYKGESHHSTGEKVHPEKNDYAVLGLTSDASNEEIKKAYKQMASQYHPDKVAHLGKELVEFATVKFGEINKAYTALRKARNF
ncbi:MAG: DnaJ domain-containing protein [Nitrospinota bacterium]|nr:DnaJ domain-containing protein [Nitrospinota bacterium]